jgi:hypothetical protein
VLYMSFRYRYQKSYTLFMHQCDLADFIMAVYRYMVSVTGLGSGYRCSRYEVLSKEVSRVRACTNILPSHVVSKADRKQS